MTGIPVEDRVWLTRPGSTPSCPQMGQMPRVRIAV